MKIFKFALLSLLLLMPLTSYAQGKMVTPSGTYDGPLHNTASPVVVELFSSQNCPACPPADKFMQSLSQKKGIIALSCHVDYFGKTSAGLDHKFCTDRQARYIERMGRKSYFTPQMMINGHMSEIGYEYDAVSASIMKGRSERVSEITIKPKASGVYEFSVPFKNISHRADLWMAVYQKPQQVSERGSKMVYYNVMSNFIPLGDWGGSSINRAVFPILSDKSAGFAIVAQDSRTGEVLAAGDYRF